MNIDYILLRSGIFKNTVVIDFLSYDDILIIDYNGIGSDDIKIVGVDEI
jgi:hypothetical protein